jgi:ribosomal protein L37AE/L43A
MATFSNKYGAKMSKMSVNEYVCVYCDYKCFKKFNWDRHILSSKHIKSTNSNSQATKNEQNEQKKDEYMCHNCNKEYKDRTGLWRHNKKCNINEHYESNKSQEKSTTELEIIKMLIKEQSDIKELILQIVKKDTYNNSTNTTNSHNKTFNLQFFVHLFTFQTPNIIF